LGGGEGLVEFWLVVCGWEIGRWFVIVCLVLTGVIGFGYFGGELDSATNMLVHPMF
jgi:hypothetical protein